MINDHYTYRLSWSPSDGEYVATCAEFPSLSWLDEDQIDALKGIKQLVADIVDDLQAHGETIPARINGFLGNFSSGCRLNFIAGWRLKPPRPGSASTGLRVSS